MGSLIRWSLVLLWLGAGAVELATGSPSLEGCNPALQMFHDAERDRVVPGPDYAEELRALALRQQDELRAACHPTNGRSGSTDMV